MADKKEFKVSLTELVDSYRKDAPVGYRYAVANELRTLADFIDKSDPWPAEVKAQEEALKRGEGSLSEPTEAEMKHAAAAEEAAKLARMRGIEDNYSSNAEADVPQSAKDERMDRQFAELRGDEDAGENVPGRPIPAPSPERREHNERTREENAEIAEDAKKTKDAQAKKK